jgi:hypothetical protein
MNHDRRHWLAASFSALLGGCYTIQETSPTGVPAPGGRHVMLVGRVEVVPRVAVGEQDIDIKNDFFNTKRYSIGRAVVVLSDRPDPNRFHVLNAQILNPALEQTYFFVAPRGERFITQAYVAMEWRDLTPNSKAMNIESAELKAPAPLEIDIRPDDQAIYLGTLRLHRDVFHTLLKVELLDHHAAAQAELRQRFGAQASLRKALLKLPPSRLSPAPPLAPTPAPTPARRT